MQRFLELLFLGLSLGSIYAVIAIGFVVVFKATRIVNLAHGSILLFGAYLLSQLHGPLGFWLGLVAALAATLALALLIELLVMRPGRGLDDGALATLTIGVDIVLLTELTRRIGGTIPDNGAPWASRIVSTCRWPASSRPVSCSCSWSPWPSHSGTPTGASACGRPPPTDRPRP
jgi:branched-chain amino acid transport system permease protein